MSSDKKRLLEELADIVRKGLEVAGIIAAELHSLDDEPGDGDQAGGLPPKAIAVYEYVRDAVAPPTRQEIIDALSDDGPNKVAGAGTVNKLITQLVRDGWIKARPRPENGYVVGRPIDEN